MNKRYRPIVLVILMAAATAQAELTRLPCPRYDDSTSIPGYVVNDIRISFTGQWFSGQLLTEGLSPGDIRQDTTLTGGINFNTPFLTLNDSFISNGGLSIADPNFKSVIEVGPAVNLDPVDAATRPKVFNDQKIDFAWAAGTGATPVDKDGWLIAHLIFKDTANGTIKMLISTTGEETRIFSTHINNGYISPLCPEPASLSLLAIGGLAILRRRRA